MTVAFEVDGVRYAPVAVLSTPMTALEVIVTLEIASVVAVG
jgi:hypothetical protein